MFFIFNKDKINSYIIIFSTVLILFGIAFSLQHNKSLETNANMVEKEDEYSNALNYSYEKLNTIVDKE